MTITIVGGCPGTGKTSLSRMLAKADEKGIHLETDKFFDFVTNKIDPSTKPAQVQNEVVVKAWCAAAKEYSAGGYEVYVDGVIGSWWFETLKRELPNYRYMMLHADLKTCLERVAGRDRQASATEELVVRMHEQFERSLADGFVDKVFDTSEIEQPILLQSVQDYFK